MREILFRGKAIKSNKWVFGDYVSDAVGISHKEYLNEYGDIGDVLTYIIPETVGQYTGLTDKNGTKIFEGDIVKAQDDIFGSPFCNGITGKVVYEETAFFIETQNPMDSQWLFNECAVYEIIGNIHDNPELQKGGIDNGHT
jgi:uncharacterized phage protein (TIGR01671 family)